MNPRLVFHLIGVVLLIGGGFMIPPLLLSFADGGSDLKPLAAGFGAMAGAGLLLFLLTRKGSRAEFRHRDAFLVVTLGWSFIALFGSLPYHLSGHFPGFTEAYFESMSGFTTTGASVLSDIEALPRGLLLWRSLTQWMGGMGIVVFSLAILPMVGSGGMQLFKAEVPEISVDRLQPRIIDTAKALWVIYAGITLAAILSYFAAGMSLYDAVCHAFTTLSTGGFSTKNRSIAHFESPLIDVLVTFFMFLGGVNFSLYYFAFRRDLGRFFRSAEFRFYLSVTVLATVGIALAVTGPVYGHLVRSLRYVAFQVVAVMTTTGYATADWELWPPFGQAMLVFLMFFGGMIGSTGGGIKQVRILVMLKKCYREIYQLIHPHAFAQVKLDGRALPKEVRAGIWGFLFLFIFVCLLATLVLTATGVDLVTSATTVISAMCNVGPALGDAGPAENYASIPALGKWILVLCMLIGRLEVYTVIILFVPHFWRK